MEGLPTFEEFCKNREKYVGREDEDFGLIDRGSLHLKNVVQRHEYEIEGVRCKNLEQVEKRAREMGIPIRELDYRAMIIPQTGLKCDILVKFAPKSEFARREDWGK